MQDSVTKTLKIIKEFVFEVRVERALLIANIIVLLLSGSKISLYQLAISSKKKISKLKSGEQKIRRLLEHFPITSKIYAKAVFALFITKCYDFGNTILNAFLIHEHTS